MGARHPRLLANRIASIDHGGVVLFVEELYVAPDLRRRTIVRALLRRLGGRPHVGHPVSRMQIT